MLAATVNLSTFGLEMGLSLKKHDKIIIYAAFFGSLLVKLFFD